GTCSGQSDNTIMEGVGDAGPCFLRDFFVDWDGGVVLVENLPFSFFEVPFETRQVVGLDQEFDSGVGYKGNVPDLCDHKVELFEVPLKFRDGHLGETIGVNTAEAVLPFDWSSQASDCMHPG